MEDKPLLIFHCLLVCIRRGIMESQHFRAGDGPQGFLINPFIVQMTKRRPREAKWLVHDHNSRAKIGNQVTEISMQFSLFYIILHKSNLRCGGMLWYSKTELCGEFLWSKRPLGLIQLKMREKQHLIPSRFLRKTINLTSPFFSPLAQHLSLGLTKLLVWSKSMLVFSRQW